MAQKHSSYEKKRYGSVTKEGWLIEDGKYFWINSAGEKLELYSPSEGKPLTREQRAANTEISRGRMRLVNGKIVVIWDALP